jgi:hypothetical protein
MIRFVVQVVLFFLLLGTVMAIGSATTGAAEKAVLVVVGLALVWAAMRLRSGRSAPRSSSASTPRA